MNPAGAIHSPITRAMVHYVSSRGVDREELCRLAEIPRSVLDNPEEKFSFRILNAAWMQAASLTDDPYIGLHVGEFLDLSALGVVGYLLQSSQTLGEAMETASRYTTLTGGAIDLSIQSESKQWKIIFGLQQSFPESVSFAIRQLTDAAMSISATMLNKLTHQVVNPLKATFVYPQPSDVTEYQRLFKALLLFDQAEDTLIYDNDIYELPVTFANPTLHALFDKHAQAMLALLRKQTDMSSMVKMVVMSRVRNERLSLQMVADELFMNARTLQRKLEREGISFQSLLDEVRQELAEDYLLRLGMSVSDTAFLVGLSEPSAFARSFKRWTGLSPKEYQIQHQKKVVS